MSVKIKKRYIVFMLLIGIVIILLGSSRLKNVVVITQRNLAHKGG